MATTAKSALELQFEEAIMSDVVECTRLGYYPSDFVRMVNEHGGVETARRLIADDRVPDGFGRLWEMGRLDMTLEACIRDTPKFHELFDKELIDRCDKRLTDAHYKPKVA